ncbi:conserved hypothetical protein [Ricinus communis]|uniref:FAS1-like dehydratase domain-containing protein n=1 Tax=Ricinus communis TaxID=3988 RepID=B9T9E5_RICCO|nr:conserved hypothetical protein [Ricinus communis]
MIGSQLERTRPDLVVNATMIRCFCASIEDSNPNFWDDDIAMRNWGGIISPPSMIATWLMPLQWHPRATQAISAMLACVPLPGTAVLNYSSDVEFVAPVYAGEQLSMYDSLLDISPPRDTRVGSGHFVTTVSTILNQHDEVRARWTNVGFRFSPNQGH